MRTRYRSKKLKVRNGCKPEAECFSVTTFCVLCQRRIAIFRTFCKRIFQLIITASLSVFPCTHYMHCLHLHSHFQNSLSFVYKSTSLLFPFPRIKNASLRNSNSMVGISLGAKFFVTQGPDVYDVKRNFLRRSMHNNALRWSSSDHTKFSPIIM